MGILGYILAPLSQTAYFIRGGLLKKRAVKNYHYLTISFYITLFSLPFLFFGFIRDIAGIGLEGILNVNFLVFIAMASVVGTVGSVIQTYLYGRIDMMHMTAVVKSVPVLATILAAVFLSEHISSFDFLALLFVSLAIALVHLNQTKEGIVASVRHLFSNKKLILLLFASLCFAIFYVVRKYVALNVGVATFLLFSNFLSVIFAFIIIKVRRIAVAPSKDFIRKIALPGLVGLGAMIFESYGYVLLPIGIAAIFANLSVFANAVLAKFWLHEKSIRVKIAASIIAGAGGVIVSVF